MSGQADDQFVQYHHSPLSLAISLFSSSSSLLLLLLLLLSYLLSLSWSSLASLNAFFAIANVLSFCLCHIVFIENGHHFGGDGGSAVVAVVVRIARVVTQWLRCNATQPPVTSLVTYCINEKSESITDGARMDERMDRWTDRQMDRRTDRWADGQTDG